MAAWKWEGFNRNQTSQSPKSFCLCLCYLVSESLALSLLSRQEDKTVTESSQEIRCTTVYQQGQK